MNWRRRKRIFKRNEAWMKQNGSNKSLQTMIRIAKIWKPDWNDGQEAEMKPKIKLYMHKSFSDYDALRKKTYGGRK